MPTFQKHFKHRHHATIGRLVRIVIYHVFPVPGIGGLVPELHPPCTPWPKVATLETNQALTKQLLTSTGILAVSLPITAGCHTATVAARWPAGIQLPQKSAWLLRPPQLQPKQRLAACRGSPQPGGTQRTTERKCLQPGSATRSWTGQ